MTPYQKALVLETWRQVVPIADQAMSLFYERLFEIDPELRPMFDGVDMAAQRKRLIMAMTAVVDSLHDVDDVLPDLEALGRRHVSYGVTDGHYKTVGDALLWTLDKGLGESWTAEAEAAWAAAYGMVADVMRGAAVASHACRRGGRPVEILG